MNRRELFGLGAWCLGGTAVAGSLPWEDAAWQVRLAMQRHELAPRVTAWAPTVQVLTRGAAGGSAVVVYNGCEQAVTFRSSGWDRDLVVAAGHRGACRLDAASAAFSAASGTRLVRGLLDVEGAQRPDVDAEYSMPIHHWPRVEDARTSAAPAHHATLGGQLLRASEPVRVRAGERVRFRFFNASAARPVSLHLPGHQFEVHAFDERALPRPVRVAHLEVAPGERVDTQVEMNHPGRWVLGSLSRVEQAAGFGRRVEYAGARGAAVAPAPAPVGWQYTRFARPADPLQADGTPLQQILVQHDAWDGCVLRVAAGRRQRLAFYNLLRAPLVLALRGHDLELRQAGPEHVSALHKDTLSVPPSTRFAVDFVPRGPRVELLRL